ncbi:hypothetical protein ElyMa_003585300 [Elysia marginata]|uniref:Uncharacterized protein n=1 Tax=Elysia marginata TaxID=1093978 RepID=A0AAV4EPF0_9GAST|nr:hypothetical protein ElyMa_003585300 [Elysia marginata]
MKIQDSPTLSEYGLFLIDARSLVALLHSNDKIFVVGLPDCMTALQVRWHHAFEQLDESLFPYVAKGPPYYANYIQLALHEAKPTRVKLVSGKAHFSYQ